MMIGTMLEARSVGLGGDDDDRHDARGAQRTAHLEPGDVGQAQVEQHQLGLLLGERRQTLPSGAGLAQLVALVLQRHAQGEADGVVVFDEQQAVHPAGTPLICYRKRTRDALSRHIGRPP
jgi:hypothetical protein